MKTNRYMDAQGRIILPADIRKALNLKAGKIVSIELDEDTIKIKASEERCAICGESITSRRYVMYKDKYVCEKCTNALHRSELHEGEDHGNN